MWRNEQILHNRQRHNFRNLSEYIHCEVWHFVTSSLSTFAWLWFVISQFSLISPFFYLFTTTSFYPLVTTLSSFSVADCDLFPAVLSPLSSINSIFHLFFMLRWVCWWWLTPIWDADSCWGLFTSISHCVAVLYSSTHTKIHTSSKEPGWLRWMSAAVVQEAVASLWRSMELFHPGWRWLYLLSAPQRALGPLYTDTVVSSDS